MNKLLFKKRIIVIQYSDKIKNIIIHSIIFKSWLIIFNCLAKFLPYGFNKLNSPNLFSNSSTESIELNTLYLGFVTN